MQRIKSMNKKKQLAKTMQNFKYNLATLKFNAYKILEYEILSINHNYQSNVMFPLSSRSPVRLQWQEKSKNQRCLGNIY